ncbi:MAG: cellulose synthase/poly-beta-1,6-N-acetylglucosamine synthase-like glycosyltransferase [Halioglobus sp.]|jgi:cellulose synthase/poly-beta-1,6-N-acetylglucosamine synthase-like glycosyltransferase
MSIVWRWFKYKNIQPQRPEAFESYPRVTIQIPLFNEKLVVERVIHAVAKVDYPHDKLQIQIVDDSTDETYKLVAGVVADYASQGLDIQHVHRIHREGFKAGALKEAMTVASGEYIAIFDADFVPSPSIIKDTINEFTNDKVAMVQFRWEHLNRYDSSLTQAQAMMLDSHFSLEQQVRYKSKALFNFNGTAGVWRKAAIVDAGNWSADTLTEDLDLSYRAQLKGWQLVYINDYGCPGELPGDMNAFKSQQHRWAKGGIQVMKKILPKVWRSKIKLKYKVEATFHLSNNLAYFIMLVDTTFLLVPSLLLREQLQISSILWIDAPLLVLSSGGHLIYFYFGQVALRKSKLQALKNMPRLLLLGVQLAYNNAKAASEALMGHQSEFVRTPKAGDHGVGRQGVDRAGEQGKMSNINAGVYKAISPQGGAVEVCLGLIYLVVFLWGIHNEQWLMLPFLLLLVIGFFTTAFSTLKGQYDLRLG